MAVSLLFTFPKLKLSDLMKDGSTIPHAPDIVGARQGLLASPMVRAFKPQLKFLQRKVRHVRAFFRRGSYRSRRGLKLNLGCGSDQLPGYVNIDLNPFANAELFLDFRKLGAEFAPGSIAEIRMMHSIGYLNLWQSQALFAEFFTLMQSNGVLILELPNLESCVERILQTAKQKVFSPEYLEGVRGLYAFGLDNLAEKRDYHPYAFGWSEWHLQSELENVGFRVRIAPPQTHGHPWRDLRVEAVKP